MIFVCPKDVKQMVVQTARSVAKEKELAAKHEYEELKEGAWLEPGLALLRKKVRVNWTRKASECAKKKEEDGRKRDCSILIGRTPVNVKPAKRMSSLSQGESHRKAQAIPLPRMVRSQTRDTRSFQEVGARSKNLKGGVEVAKR